MNSTQSTSARRPSTAASKGSSADGRKHTWLKEQFTLKHGLRHHSYDSEKAPYPLSYDRHVLELESMDNRLIKFLRNDSISFLKFADDDLPERILDLGCGSGNWVIEAAREFPQAEFVGLDLVNVQIPLKILEPSVAKRISWVHGNFLTTKLPFEDDEFDHVHLQSIAKGVPENKWGNLFEEICRVMRPGGSIEIIEEDAIFPSLPRWFTAPLRARPRRTLSVHLPDGSHRSSSPPTAPSEPNHDHALLEDLYSAVFEHRFINQRPTALLPNYVTTYFRQVNISPLLSFPMPPMPPPQPLPPAIVTTYAAGDSPTDALDPRMSRMLSPPNSAAPIVPGRPTSISFSSTISSTSTAVTSLSSAAILDSITRAKYDSAATSISLPPDLSMTALFTNASEKAASDTWDSPSVPSFILDKSLSELRRGPAFTQEETLLKLNQRSLAMHLYKSSETVLACQEALWEEMKDRLRNRRDELQPFGWDDDEELEELQNRKRFERLIERYRSDMQSRMSLWCSLNEIGWPFPPRDPLSRAEIIEEERVREAMLEARRYALPEDNEILCRSMRIMTGYKL